MGKGNGKTDCRVYTWTFKGEIYVRKNTLNAPKRKVLSEEYLSKIMKGDISLDVPTFTNDVNALNSIVIYEDVMGESVPSATDV